MMAKTFSAHTALDTMVLTIFYKLLSSLSEKGEQAASMCKISGSVPVNHEA